MKNRYIIIISLLSCLFALSQCSKSPGETTTPVCTTCTMQCVNGTIHINGVGIAGNPSYCGDSAGIQHWEDSLNTEYSNANGYTMTYTNGSSISHRYCGTQAQINDTISLFAAQGYKCQ